MWDLIVTNMPWLFSGVGIVAVLAAFRSVRGLTLVPVIHGWRAMLKLLRGLLWNSNDLNDRVEMDVRSRGRPLELWLDETPRVDIWLTITNHSPLDLTFGSLSAEWAYGGVSAKAVESEPNLVVPAHTTYRQVKVRMDLTDAQANRIAQSESGVEGHIQIRAKAEQGWRSWSLCSGGLERIPARLVNAQIRMPDKPNERI